MWRKHKFDWAIMLQNNVKAKYRFIPWKFFGDEVFQRSVCSICIHLTIKALYFRSFVVSVLFAPFHFKIIRKLLSLLGLLEKVFELLVTMTKHVLNLFNNDFVMLWITLFFATPAKLLHLLVPSEYDSRKPFTNTYQELLLCKIRLILCAEVISFISCMC